MSEFTQIIIGCTYVGMYVGLLQNSSKTSSKETFMGRDILYGGVDLVVNCIAFDTKLHSPRLYTTVIIT